MAISPYFKHITSAPEQQLADDLSRESIQMRGLDLQYIPRSASDVDDLFGEVSKETYQASVTIEMYVENQTGFEGEGDFFTANFGLDIRDEASIDINKNRFTQEMSVTYPGITIPREGDLIYYALADTLLEISYVEKEDPFYPRGTQTNWKIKAKKFEYNQDVMNSGITDVDDIETDPELFNDSTEIQTESDTSMDFSEDDPFSTNDY